MTIKQLYLIQNKEILSLKTKISEMESAIQKLTAKKRKIPQNNLSDESTDDEKPQKFNKKNKPKQFLTTTKMTQENQKTEIYVNLLTKLKIIIKKDKIHNIKKIHLKQIQNTESPPSSKLFETLDPKKMQNYETPENKQIFPEKNQNQPKKLSLIEDYNIQCIKEMKNNQKKIILMNEKLKNAKTEEEFQEAEKSLVEIMEQQQTRYLMEEILQEIENNPQKIILDDSSEQPIQTLQQI